MSLTGKKLGLLLSAPPDQPNFDHAIALASAAVKQGVQVYFYCIDDSVAGLDHPKLQQLKAQGINLFACAYGAQRRDVQMSDLATFAGLSVVSDLMASTDRFVSFN